MYGGMYVCISQGTHMCRSHAYVVSMRIWRSEVDFGYLSGGFLFSEAGYFAQLGACPLG